MTRPFLRAAVLLGGLVLVLGCQKADTPAGISTSYADVGFATPESVLFDPLTEFYYVSNINGGPLDEDGNGFISILDPLDGVLRNLKWIDGATEGVTLNAPKGMALAGEYLFVADINMIRWFDRRTGEPVGQLAVPGATFLNDMAADLDGTLYFTDSGLRAAADGFEPSGTDAVYRLPYGGTLDTLVMGPELGRPNGIAVSGDSVWVVTYGANELFRVANGARTDVVTLPKGGLDGLVLFNGTMYISSWEGNAIYRGTPGGPFTELLSGLTAPADIGHDGYRHQLLVPLFMDHAVRLVPLAP